MDAFAALADPVRRDLVSRLATGPARVVDLAADHDISRPAISRHLRVLGDAGLVTAQDVGRERHYRIARRGLAPLRGFLDGLSPASGVRRPPMTRESSPVPVATGSGADVRVTGDQKAGSTEPLAPRFTETTFDGLDLEVRRTVHERREGTAASRPTTRTPTTTEETA